MDEDEMDREVERILAMSGDEIKAEIIAQGDDPDECVRLMDEAIASAVATYLRSINRLQ
jgi:hypothetical protein